MPAGSKKNDTSFSDFVLDQLAPLRGLRCRSMFGGNGLYAGDVFFGILFKGRLYFRTDEQTRSKYAERGMGPFKPSPRQTLKTYYEVPADILEDHDRIVEWAKRAVNIKK